MTEIPIRCGHALLSEDLFIESRCHAASQRGWDSIKFTKGGQMVDLEEWLKSKDAYLAAKDRDAISIMLEKLTFDDVLYIDFFQVPSLRLMCMRYEGLTKESWTEF